MDCEVTGCEEAASVELDIPWTDNELVCAGHARVRARRDGVVANPLESADEALPGGASDRAGET